MSVLEGSTGSPLRLRDTPKTVAAGVAVSSSDTGWGRGSVGRRDYEGVVLADGDTESTRRFLRRAPPWVGQPYGQPGPNPQFPPSWGYPAQPGGQPQPYPGNPSYPYPNFAQAPDPQAPFGRDPISGVPLSDKSAATVGLLQLFFGFAGIGRFYVGSNSVATAQLCL
nr:TM2 domain-containing protein [Mycobacterium ulcerans]